MKHQIRLLWSVTIFMVTIFCQPGLLVRACIANPTNYLSQAVSVDKVVIVTTVDERIPQDKPKVLAPIIFFTIIVLVTAWIVYQIIKLLDKVIPPPEKKPDPPPNSGNTNIPPITVNPTQENANVPKIPRKRGASPFISAPLRPPPLRLD